MDPNTRVDLFIACHDSEELSAGFTTNALATKTEEAVRLRATNKGTKPFIFVGSMAGRGEIADAVMQTRPGGLALFLVTPSFFSNSLCVSTLRAFLQVCSDSNVHLKLRFVCLESSANDIRSSASVKEQVPNLSDFGRWKDISVTTIHATSADLCDVVFSAWECTDEFVSAGCLPTLVGRTRYISFLVMQRAFTDDDLPMFRALLSLPQTVTNVQDAFMKAAEHYAITQHDLKSLHDFILIRNCSTAEEQRRMVQAYERKWVDSTRLSWEIEVREDLLRLFKNEETGTSQTSSSSRPQKRLRRTDADLQETSESSRRQPRETRDVFKPYFVEPPHWGDVVLDFTSCDEKRTPEGLLLRKVLEPFEDHAHRTVSASGWQRSAMCGMGGVGKTTALKALCYNEQVKEAYYDGICYLEFGQDADNGKVIKQVARCVHEFGGRKKAKKIEKSTSLSDVIERGAEWLRGRTVLLICDDLWANSNKYGYLKHITNLLQYAPRSRLVISTRDLNIADSAGGIVEFVPLNFEGAKAREILLADFPALVNVTNISDEATNDSIRRILRICAGLPLALAIARHGLSKSVRDSNDNVSIGARLYCQDLEQDVTSLMGYAFDHYPGLAIVIDSSLNHCDEWGKSDEVKRAHGTLDMKSMFTGLCVLEKQMVIPKRVLKHLWGTDDRCTKNVLEKFADCNLASRVVWEPSTKPEFGLRLHDLVLEGCQQMAGRECSKWHKKIIDAYAKDLPVDVNDEEGEKIRPWWSAEDDGYILGHLSKHLVSSEQAGELELLLCDIRWTILQMKIGGWSSLNSDFDRLFEVEEYAKSGMSRVHKVLKDSIPYAREQYSLLGFYVSANLSREEREQAHVARLLSSIDGHFPGSLIRPVNRMIAVSDAREERKEVFSSDVHDIIVDWKKGTMIVASNNEVMLWSTNDRRPIWTIQQEAIAIATSKDGSLLVSWSPDGTIRRLNARSGAQIGPSLIGQKYSATCIAVSEDGKTIVSVSKDGALLRWNAESGAQIGSSRILHESHVTCFDISEDATIIAFGYKNKKIRLFDAQSGAPIGHPLIGHEGGMWCIALSQDGRLILSASSDRTMRFWGTRSGAQIGNPIIGHSLPVTCLALSESRNVIVSAYIDGTLRRWDAQSGAQIGEPLIGHERTVSCVAVQEDGSVVLSGSHDRTIRRWEAQRGPTTGGPPIRREDFVVCAAISKYARWVVLGMNNKTVRCLDAESGNPICDPLIGHEGQVTCVAVYRIAYPNLIVSGSVDKTIRRWDSCRGTQIGDPLIGHEGSVTCVAVRGFSQAIVSGSDDKSIRRWDARSGAQIGDPLVGHEEAVTCIAVSVYRNTIVSGSSDKTIRRWNAKSGEPIGAPMIAHQDAVTCIALSEDEKTIVSGSRDCTIRVWDLQSGAQIGDPLIGHQRTVTCVSVDVRRFIYSGSWDGAVRQWDRLRVAGSGSSQVISREFDSVLANGRVTICRPRR